MEDSTDRDDITAEVRMMSGRTFELVLPRNYNIARLKLAIAHSGITQERRMWPMRVVIDGEVAAEGDRLRENTTVDLLFVYPECDAEGPELDIFCPVCRVTLNGPRQADDHESGRKHQYNLSRLV